MLNEFRAREGAELAAFIREQNATIRSGSEEMQRIRAGAVPAFQKRLIEKLQELLGNTMIDPQRLAQEAALARRPRRHRRGDLAPPDSLPAVG